MSTRAAIEEVLRKHLHPKVFRLDDEQYRRAFVDDLLALLERPQPSKESLERLLADPQVPVSTLVPALMAWAQGEPRLEWCEHIEWTQDGNNTWRWWIKSVSDPPIRDNWIVCPICGAPRPQEAAP